MSHLRMRAYVIVLLLASGCMANTLLLWPPKQTTTYPQLRTMIGDIEVFQAVTDQSTEPDAYALCFFGNAMLADIPVAQIATEFHGMHLEIWGVNYPGFGGSKGEATLAGVARSAREVYAALAAQAHGKPIILFGISLGTAAALHVAAHEHVSKLVLLNPPPLPELILRRYGWWNLFLVALPVALAIPDELDSVANAAHVTAPALFLSASDDGVVPISYQEQIMKAYAGDWELLEMRGSGHNSPLPQWVIARLKAWVAPGRTSS